MKKEFIAILICAIAHLLFADRAIGDLALEYFKLHNKVALEILSGKEDEVEKSIEKATSLRTKAVTHVIRCETCKGARPFIVTEPDQGQNSGRIKKSEMLGQHKVVCPICKGRGSIRALREIDDIEKEFARALRTFEAKNLAEGLIKTNGAFLTSAQIEKATQLQMESVRSIMGQPCKRCKSSGVSECRKCKGEGFTKCRNSGCKEGWFKFQRKNTSKTKYAPTFKICPECKGTERTVCPECHGERGRICKDCSGEGFTHKKR